MQFSPRAAQKSKFSKLIFFNIVTTQDDHPRYVRHVLAVFMCFSPSLGIVWGGGGVPRGWVDNLFMQFFTLGSSKIKVLETYFFDAVIT